MQVSSLAQDTLYSHICICSSVDDYLIKDWVSNAKYFLPSPNPLHSVETPGGTGIAPKCFRMCLMAIIQVAGTALPGQSKARPVPYTHLELKVCVFQDLLVHGFCKLVDSSQEDPGRGEKVTRPSEHATLDAPPPCFSLKVPQ